MMWVTREGAKTDRVACPWLITRFIDPEAEFSFVAKDQVLPAALGFARTTSDDHEKLRLQFPLYDALYAFCRDAAA